MVSLERLLIAEIPYKIKFLLSDSAMEELDGDTVRLSSRGRTAERDIVQVSAAFTTVSISTLGARPFPHVMYGSYLARTIMFKLQFEC